MARRKQSTLAEPPADPFGERHRSGLRERFQLMGGQFHFETDNASLAQIVRAAYSRLPSHKFAGLAPRFLVRLALAATQRACPSVHTESEPPRVRSFAAGGILCGAMETANFVALTPQQRSALVVVSPEMLRFPYYVRYEMLEFAVYVLASRAQGLVPLHAACVGRGGRGILLLGSSGSGKSTVSLHCLLQGLEFLAEDSVLVDPNGLATGIANYLHVRPDSLEFLEDAARAALIRGSPVIRRRSGVEKFEVDLRRPQYRLATAPLRIDAVVFLSPRRAGGRTLLAPMRRAQLTQKLAASQRYAAKQPGWSVFIQRVCRLPAFELSRGNHPLQAVEALKELLSSGPTSSARKRERP
ncbi:MAG: serine kinase [Steroidobacteraceae bacterium]